MPCWQRAIFKKCEVVKWWILSYIFIKVMHEFDSRLPCANLKNQRKTSGSLCKKILNVLVVIVLCMTWSRCQFHTKQSRNLLNVILVFFGSKMGMAHQTVQMEFSNITIIWTNADLIIIFLDILPFAQCQYCPPTT